MRIYAVPMGVHGPAPGHLVPTSTDPDLDRGEIDRPVIGRLTVPATYLTGRPRGEPTWLLMVTEYGAGRVTGLSSATGHGAPGEPIQLARGRAAVLPPGRPHVYGTDPQLAPWRFWWVHFHLRAGWAELVDVGSTGTGRLFTDLPDTVVDEVIDDFVWMHAAARWTGHGPIPPLVRAGEPAPAFAPAPQGWAMVAPHLESVLLLLAGNSGGHQQSVDDRVTRALAVVAADPAAAHTMTSLAAEVALSPSRLAHLCKADLGTPLMHEVRRIKLNHAALLLEQTSLSIGQVAHASGYVSQFHFSHAFTAKFGVPPSVFRQSIQYKHAQS
jgi:AraC family transcriptional regulator of arabinose operon